MCSFCEYQINNILKPNIEKAILNHFGATVDIKATIHKGGWYGYYVTVEDILTTDIDKKMRANKLLRTLFINTSIKGDVWYTEEDSNIGIRFNVYYSHPVGGGSNGHEIGTIYINTRNKTVRWK